MLESGDLLMSLTGNVGRVAILADEFLPAALNQRVACLRMKDDRISKRYLFHILNSDFFEQQCIQTSKGVAQKNMSTEWLKEYEIPLYSEKEQAEIVSVFDCISNVVASRKQELTKLDELIKARFVEMFKDGKFHSVPLIETVKKGAGLSYGIVVPGENVIDGIPMVRPSDFNNGQIDLSNVYRVAPEIEFKYSKTRLIGDEVLVQVIGQPGQVMLATEDCAGMNVTRNLAVIRPNHELINRIYLKEYIEKEDSQQVLLKNTKQSTLKQLPLNLLKQLEVQLPPMELQNEFAAFVKQVNKSKVAIQKSLKETQLLFDSLMQDYFG